MSTNFDKLIPEDFRFADPERVIHDKKLEAKPIGYFKDALRRFKRNKASIVAAFIILFLILFAIVVPMFSKYSMSFSDPVYRNRIPKSEALSKIGIMTGTYTKQLNGKGYENFRAVGVGASYDRATDTEDLSQGIGGAYSPLREAAEPDFERYYYAKVDAYYEIGFQNLLITQEEYADILDYEAETGMCVLYPVVDASLPGVFDASDPNWWYQTDERGYAVLDAQGNFIDRYLRDDNGKPVYSVNRDRNSLMVRVLYHNYFVYKNGTAPGFFFGTNNVGQDILVRLAMAIRLSMILALGVSVINLVLGAVYGAVEGYYGGRTDLVMQRITDILSGVPFIIVATLFQLHLANSAGVVPSLLFAFVLTGWIGTANRVRTQFYRFKNQEYVLAARTLGARDRRLMFKHIFPNTLGTIITSSVLVIPNVIFSESMLSYLGIVNLSGSQMTSIGAMLSDGQAIMSAYPHVILFPAIVISLLMISFNLFGNGLRDAFNPSLRGGDES